MPASWRKIHLAVSLKTPEEIEMEAKKRIENLQEAARETTPFIKEIKSNVYPNEMRVLIAEKRKAKKNCSQTEKPTYKNILNKLTGQIKREIREHQQSSLQSFLESCLNASDQEKADLFADHLKNTFQP